MRILLILTVFLLLGGCVPRDGVIHVVQERQTLYTICRTYGVDERHVARLNGISDPGRLKAGQQLFIPGATQSRNVPSTVVRTSPKSSPPKYPVPRKPDPVLAKETPTPAREAAPPVKAARPQKGEFIWPLKGNILKKFEAGGAAPSKGVEIAAPLGTPVVSAAAGRVSFCASGIRGYGNLIILSHDDSYHTVYGYNQKNLVKVGDFVSKGQKIALCGTPPRGGKPCLHFELREGKSAVDPLFYLP